MDGRSWQKIFFISFASSSNKENEKQVPDVVFVMVSTTYGSL